MGSSMEDAVGKEGWRKVVKQGFELVSLDGRRSCSAVLQITAGPEHEQSRRSLRITEDTNQGVQTIGQAEVIKMPQVTNTPTAIWRTDCSLLFVMKAALMYNKASEPRYSAPVAETCIKDIVENRIPPRYMPEQSRCAYIRYVRPGRLMEKDGDVLALLE